jgi:hypothetical protein
MEAAVYALHALERGDNAPLTSACDCAGGFGDLYENAFAVSILGRLKTSLILNVFDEWPSSPYPVPHVLPVGSFSPEVFADPLAWMCPLEPWGTFENLYTFQTCFAIAAAGGERSERIISDLFNRAEATDSERLAAAAAAVYLSRSGGAELWDIFPFPLVLPDFAGQGTHIDVLRAKLGSATTQ